MGLEEKSTDDVIRLEVFVDSPTQPTREQKFLELKAKIVRKGLLPKRFLKYDSAEVSPTRDVFADFFAKFGGPENRKSRDKVVRYQAQPDTETLAELLDATAPVNPHQLLDDNLSFVRYRRGNMIPVVPLDTSSFDALYKSVAEKIRVRTSMRVKAGKIVELPPRRPLTNNHFGRINRNTTGRLIKKYRSVTPEKKEERRKNFAKLAEAYIPGNDSTIYSNHKLAVHDETRTVKVRRTIKSRKQFPPEVKSPPRALITRTKSYTFEPFLRGKKAPVFFGRVSRFSYVTSGDSELIAKSARVFKPDELIRADGEKKGPSNFLVFPFPSNVYGYHNSISGLRNSERSPFKKLVSAAAALALTGFSLFGLGNYSSSNQNHSVSSNPATHSYVTTASATTASATKFSGDLASIILGEGSDYETSPQHVQITNIPEVPAVQKYQIPTEPEPLVEIPVLPTITLTYDQIREAYFEKAGGNIRGNVGVAWNYATADGFKLSDLTKTPNAVFTVEPTNEQYETMVPLLRFVEGDTLLAEIEHIREVKSQSYRTSSIENTVFSANDGSSLGGQSPTSNKGPTYVQITTTNPNK